MRIDNYLRDTNGTLDPKEIAFCRKVEAILVKEPQMEYADIVRAYREIEDEFVNHAGYVTWEPLETKRRIAERIVRAAHDAGQPFEICRDAWNALVELGFSSIDMFCTMAWWYAGSCLFNAQYDVGLEVLDIAFAEIDRRLNEPGLTRYVEAYYDHELATLDKLRERLMTYKSSVAEGITLDERYEAESDAKSEPSPRERQDSELMCKLSGSMYRVRKTSAERSFAEMVVAYRNAEEEFLASLGADDTSYVPEVRRQIAAAILEEAHAHNESFDVCRQAWNELLQCGFGKRTDQCALTRTYAACCLFNREPEAGLAVVEPLLAELQKQLDERTDTEMPRRRHAREISRLQKLRNDLVALRPKS